MYTHSFGLNRTSSNYNHYRNDDNNNDKTKNEQLKIVLDSIIKGTNPKLTENILNYTINIISGNSENNIPSMLENKDKIKKAINYLTANSSKYFPQNITRGAVQIIFVACYNLVKQKQVEGMDIDKFDLSNRNSKINLVKDSIRKMRNDVVINFPNKEYFDIININKEKLNTSGHKLNISGNGYNYTIRDFRGANLRGADLTGAKFNSAIFDDKTIFSDNFFKQLNNTDFNINITIDSIDNKYVNIKNNLKNQYKYFIYVLNNQKILN